MTDKLRGLQRAFDEILAEARANPKFAERLEGALESSGEKLLALRSHRRKPGVIDPFAIYREGGDVLRQRLGNLSIEELKDIVAQHGMDRSKLAMKWRTPDRFIELIIETVQARARKGDAFRDPGSSQHGKNDSQL